LTDPRSSEVLAVAVETMAVRRQGKAGAQGRVGYWIGYQGLVRGKGPDGVGPQSNWRMLRLERPKYWTGQAGFRREQRRISIGMMSPRSTCGIHNLRLLTKFGHTEEENGFFFFFWGGGGGGGVDGKRYRPTMSPLVRAARIGAAPSRMTTKNDSVVQYDPNDIQTQKPEAERERRPPPLQAAKAGAYVWLIENVNVLQPPAKPA